MLTIRVQDEIVTAVHFFSRCPYQQKKLRRIGKLVIKSETRSRKFAMHCCFDIEASTEHERTLESCFWKRLLRISTIKLRKHCRIKIFWKDSNNAFEV
jgi:hypothetical protein